MTRKRLRGVMEEDMEPSVRAAMHADLGIDVSSRFSRETIEKIAKWRLKGLSKKEIMQRMKITQKFLLDIEESDTYLLILNSLTDEVIKNAKIHLKRETSARLTPEIMRVLTEELANNNLKAVDIALNILGFKKDEPVMQDSTINLVLPTQVPLDRVEHIIVAQAKEIKNEPDEQPEHRDLQYADVVSRYGAQHLPVAETVRSDTKDIDNEVNHEDGESEEEPQESSEESQKDLV